MNYSTSSLSYVLLLAVAAAFSTCEAFAVAGRAPTHPGTALSYSREICSFDSDDFALPTGEWPYTDADMNRLDNSDDENFYDEPRFVTHIDDYAIQSLTEFYAEEMSEKSRQKKESGLDAEGKIDVLDLCSSWISHLPSSDVPLGRVVGIGMNKKELEANKQLTENYVQNLNVNPSLEQFDDNSFDFVCNVVSVDYLTKTKEIFAETHRILRPGGKCLISFSNRMFPTKAIAMWLQADDIDRLTIVASYFHYAAEWKSIEALDIKIPPAETPARPGLGEMFNNPAKGFAWANTASAIAKVKASDPMFVVKGVK